VALSNSLINALLCLRFLSITSFMLLLLSVLFVSFVLCSILCICALVVTTELTLVLYSQKLNSYSIIIIIIIIIIITGN
jgi:hypothetical protein